MRKKCRRDRRGPGRAGGPRTPCAPPGGSTPWPRTSNRSAGPRFSPSSTACWPPRNRPPNCRNASARCKQTVATGRGRKVPLRSRRYRRSSSRPGEGPLRAGRRQAHAVRASRAIPAGCETARSARRHRLFRPSGRIHRRPERGDPRPSGEDPGDHARQRPGGSRRSGAAAIQGARGGLLPSPLPRLAMIEIEPAARTEWSGHILMTAGSILCWPSASPACWSWRSGLARDRSPGQSSDRWRCGRRPWACSS